MAGDHDPLSDVLDGVRLTGAVFFLWEPSWPFAYNVGGDADIGAYLMPDAERIVSYHLVLEGPCWGAVANEDPIRLDTGDIFVVPQGDAYVMSSEAIAPSARAAEQSGAVLAAIQSGELGNVIRDGGGSETCNRIICGFMGCELKPFNPVLGSLPRVLKVPRPGEDDALGSLVDFALRESTQESRGGRSVLRKLSELMFVEVLRRHIAMNPGDDEGWLSGLRDPIVGKALAMLHRAPAERWTLERLAENVSASRSTLAERFGRLVGMPPMQYLAQWRMQLAARRLTDGEVKLYAVAQEVGYESEAAFSRAFKRIVGVAPTEWRESRSRFGPPAVVDG